MKGNISALHRNNRGGRNALIFKDTNGSQSITGNIKATAYSQAGRNDILFEGNGTINGNTTTESGVTKKYSATTLPMASSATTQISQRIVRIMRINHPNETIVLENIARNETDCRSCEALLVTPLIPNGLSQIRGQTFKSIQRHENRIPSSVGKLSEAREQFAFFLDGIMAFASDNEQNIEATVIEPRHAENPRIFLS